MRIPPPRMTRAQIETRATEKRQQILDFLASGEVYSAIDVFGALLGTSRPRAFATLVGLERDCALKSEVLTVEGRRMRLWGITAHGLALAERFDSAAFELGKTNPSYVQHRLECQRMRLAAEAVGWRDWIPERALRGRKMRKVPDALALNPAGHRIAVEVERHCKTPKRYAELMIAYLVSIKAGDLREVHFVCPAGIAQLVQKSMARVVEVRHAGERIPVSESHRARFKYFEFSEWPPKGSLL